MIPSSQVAKWSYSGTDVKAYAYFPWAKENIVALDSLATISWSVHESKAPVRSLGYRGVKGFTKSIRTIAGSLIMTIMEDHPLANLMNLDALSRDKNQYYHEGWSLDRDINGTGSGLDSSDFGRKLGPLLPPFNIYLAYVSEGSRVTINNVSNEVRKLSGGPDANFISIDGEPATQDRFTVSINGAATAIEYIELIDEGLVTSINDSVTEITYSFMARDVKTFSAQNFIISDYRPSVSRTEMKGYVVRETIGNSRWNATASTISLDDIPE